MLAMLLVNSYYLVAHFKCPLNIWLECLSKNKRAIQHQHLLQCLAKTLRTHAWNANWTFRWHRRDQLSWKYEDRGHSVQVDKSQIMSSTDIISSLWRKFWSCRTRMNVKLIECHRITTSSCHHLIVTGLEKILKMLNHLQRFVKLEVKLDWFHPAILECKWIEGLE